MRRASYGRMPLAVAAMAAIAAVAQLPAGRAQEGQCASTASSDGAGLFGLAECPCLVQDAPNGYMAAVPDDLPTA